MSNLSYHQPKVEPKPSKLLSRTIYAHQGYVSSVAFFGPECDQLITGSYDETVRVRSCGEGGLEDTVILISLSAFATGVVNFVL